MKRGFLLLIVAALLFAMVGCASQSNDLDFSGGNSAILAPNVDHQADQQQGENNSTPTPDSEQNQQSNQTPSEDQLAGNEPESDEPAIDQPVKDEPAEDEPAEDEPIADEPTEDEPADDQPEIDYTDWLTICSYNVKVLWYDHEKNGEGTSMSKFDAVCDELRKIDADIVGLQELDRWSNRCGTQVDQLMQLAQALGYPYFYYTMTVSPTGAGSEYGHGILSRYRIKKSESFMFSQFAGNIDASEPRGFSRCELDVNGKTLVFYNAHLAEKVDKQINVITERMEKDKKAGKYAVLTGDMNAQPATVETGIGSKPCLPLNTVIAPQHTVYQPSTNEKPNAIDNIVITDNLDYYWDEALQSGIVVTYTSASDHLPIYTKVNFK